MSRWIIAGLLIILAGLQYRLWVAEGGLAHSYRLKTQLAAVRDDIEVQRARNAALEAEVRDLQSGVEAVEARARLALGMVRPDETFYLIVTSALSHK